MKRARKSDRISWAPGVNLCQVKLFLSDDYPSKVGQKVQDNLQAKASRMLHSNTMESNDLPPGFEGGHFMKQLKGEPSNIPVTRWKIPPRFIVNRDWRVTAGEESEEKEAQNVREMRVLEAVYPRLSSIPPCPSLPVDVEYEHYDDTLTPVVPIIPIEEEESTNIKPEIASTIPAPVTSRPQPLPQAISSITTSNGVTPPPVAPGKPTPTGLVADVSVAASAALAAIMKSGEKGSMIDTDLLIKILSDPKMIETLSHHHGLAASAKSELTTSSGTPPSDSKLVASSAPFSVNKPNMPANQNMHPLLDGIFPTLNAFPSQQDTVLMSGLKHAAPAAAMPCTEPATMLLPSNGSLHLVANQVRPTICPMPNKPNTVSITFAAKEAYPVVKDANYYKSLIRQHGSEKQDKQDPQITFGHSNMNDLKPVHKIKAVEVKQKFQKPCMYFKSSRGCRNGSNCPYQHDMSVQWGPGSGVVGAPNAKRLKLSAEITGRT